MKYRFKKKNLHLKCVVLKDGEGQRGGARHPSPLEAEVEHKVKDQSQLHHEVQAGFQHTAR